jgi:FAD/FMN-containing dehydrogenase
MLFASGLLDSAPPQSSSVQKGTIVVMKYRTVTLEQHDSDVARIARELRDRKSTRPLSLRKKVTSHQVPKPGDKKYSDDKIDVSCLNRILAIDVEGRTCTAEPGVTFIDLVRATLPLGLVPIVVPEFKTITIGGAVSGCSIESMSFRYGGFHDSCIEYDVITSAGDVLFCTPDNGLCLVYHSIHGSFGTQGILSKLKFKLISAKPIVRVVYERHTNLESYRASILAHAEKRDVDFMDGIIHSPDLYVLSLGHFVDSAPYTHAYNWITAYHETTAVHSEDYLRTIDYFFRYDRGVTNVHPKSKLGRLLFSPFMSSNNVLRIAEKFHWALPKKNPMVTVDLFIPISRFPEFMSWYWKEFGPHNLWCVPYRPAQRYAWLSDQFYSGLQDEMFVDLAIYGFQPRDGRNYYRMIEEKLHEISGVKTLISYNYYSEEEFWQVFHRENHFAAKAITDPRNVFRDLFNKTCIASQGRTSST